jgi:serine/threonine protein phosphatase 1
MESASGLASSARALPLGRRLYAIGDIHGRMDLLQSLLERIQEDNAARANVVEPPVLVFMGDYVDRGLRSRDVVGYLAGSDLSPFSTRFLMGNHEAALLRFLERPDTGPAWVTFGGGETLYSYGVQAPSADASRAAWEAASAAFQAQLPAQHLAFLKGLELSFVLGGYAFVHAGFRPGRAIADQEKADMVAIREPFLSAGDVFGYTVVHGHTPVHTAEIRPGRIAVDTGAYVTGRLSAVRLEGEDVSFLTT